MTVSSRMANLGPYKSSETLGSSGDSSAKEAQNDTVMKWLLSYIKVPDTKDVHLTEQEKKKNTGISISLSPLLHLYIRNTI